MTSYVIMFGQALICWNCNYLKNVSKSTTDAEIMAVYAGVMALKSLLNLAKAIGLPPQFRNPVFVDNQRAVDICSQPLQPGANGHLDAKYFSIRDDVDADIIQLIKIPSADNYADAIVTYKSKEVFHRLISAIMGHSPIKPPSAEHSFELAPRSEPLPPNQDIPVSGNSAYPSSLPTRKETQGE